MSEERFWSLVSQLQENYRVGACTRMKCRTEGCRNRAAGVSKCGECCARELGQLIGDRDLVESFEAYTKATQWLLDDMLESLNDAG